VQTYKNEEIILKMKKLKKIYEAEIEVNEKKIKVIDNQIEKYRTKIDEKY